MALHRLTSVTIGVPDVGATAAYYEEFGLTPIGAGRFATVDGGEQLNLVPSPRRRLMELGVGADDADDIGRIAAQLAKLGVAVECGDGGVAAVDPGTQTRVAVRIAERIRQAETQPAACNTPGCVARTNSRADAVSRQAAARPRKRGHVVLGSTDTEASERFFIHGIGFKVSDTVAGLATFLRCSTDH